MTCFDSVKPIRDQIEALVRSAWSLDSTDRVIYGRPRGDESDTYPFVSIRLDSIARAFDGVRSVTETMAFEMLGVFEIDPGVIVADAALVKARALSEALLGYTGWGVLGGYMPEVPMVEFPDMELADKAFAVSVRFQVLTDQTQ